MKTLLTLICCLLFCSLIHGKPPQAPLPPQAPSEKECCCSTTQPTLTGDPWMIDGVPYKKRASDGVYVQVTKGGCSCVNCPKESCAKAGECGREGCGFARTIKVAGYSACADGSCGISSAPSASYAPMTYSQPVQTYSMAPTYFAAPVAYGGSCSSGSCGMSYAPSYSSGSCSSGSCSSGSCGVSSYGGSYGGGGCASGNCGGSSGGGRGFFGRRR